MKSKLRRITVNSIDYLYKVEGAFVKKEDIGYLDFYCITTLKVFRKGFRQTPLTIHIKTKEYYPSCNPLLTGVRLKQENKEVIVNLNLPSIIRSLILLEVNRNWNPLISAFLVENGLELLTELKIDVTPLKLIPSQ